MAVNVQIFTGTFIHCKKIDEPEVIEDGVMVIHCQKIVHIGDSSTYDKQRKSFPTAEIIKLTPTQILIPGLIDTHIHAPQYPNSGLGYDKPLLEWLTAYTYPTETLFKESAFAQLVYDAVVRKTIAHGTTTAAYFATIFKDTNLLLADACIKNGQRAFIGKVNMITLAPKDYIETRESSIADTKQFIKDVYAKKSDLVQPIITPRFALSVDTELMLDLADIVEEFDLNIQTHISENKEEIDQVKKAYGMGYAEAYDNARLLTPKTILAHGIYLEDDELKLLEKKGTSISHCPSSNTLLKSGMCDVRKILKAKVKVGLGTDVAGGAQPSIIEAMRKAIEVSTCISFGKNCCYQPLNYAEVFYLATLGGAAALGIEEKVGNFEVGKEFDAVIVDMDVKNSAVDYFKRCTPLELLQKFIFLGDDRNVINVFVQGKKVKGGDSH
ncbi:guanine deaminase isoform X2 [Onthophagus taurus]|nr:guanine deaminase isoform X2 [Onthophagus taurus]